ncbi:MAG: TetR/AcrR family transcriptional regulator [Calditrichaeota bacterium]|nr:MAG: TetR/AcrR family transcriptional regulator [Calditrichota bacterium]
MSPRTVDKSAKKRALLRASMKVFARKGFAKAKMIDIANEAGIGKGTIYEYFRSKDQIFIDAFHFFIGDLEAEYDKILSSPKGPIEKFEEIIDTTIDGFLAAGDFGGILMDFWAEGIRNHQQIEMEHIFNLKEVYQKYREIIAEVIEDGIRIGKFREIDAKLSAAILIGCLDGLLLQSIMDPKMIDLRKAARVCANIFISGLAR